MIDQSGYLPLGRSGLLAAALLRPVQPKTMSALAQLPPLLPSAPSPVWVTVRVGGFSGQDLRRYRTKKGLVRWIEVLSEKLDTARTTELQPEAVIWRSILPTPGRGKQSTWLAASGRPAHLWAWPSPTPGESADAHRKGSVCRFLDSRQRAGPRSESSGGRFCGAMEFCAWV